MRLIGLICLVFYCMQCSNPKCNNSLGDSSSYISSTEVALSEPYIELAKSLFIDSTQLYIQSPIPDAWVSYTIDGSTPTSDGLRYDSTQYVSFSGKYKFRAFHERYKASEVVELYLTKLAEEVIPYTIASEQTPHANYRANGWETISDLTRGQSNYYRQWLGFQENKIEIKLSFEGYRRIKKISIGFLAQQSAWIFLPKKLEIRHKGQHLASYDLPDSDLAVGPLRPMIELSIDELSTDELDVIVTPLEAIPEWHDGYGSVPWTFIDELIIQ